MKGHPASAEKFLRDESRVNWHDETIWWVRSKRDAVAGEIKDWEKLRETASQIKEHTLSKLDDYLREFEQNAMNNGIQVHWAKDAGEHNEIVLRLLKRKNAWQLVKSKSMLTEECGMNDYLEDHGIEVIESDLGERIIQWMDQTPSHIVMPAIHLKKKDIGKVFSKKLNIQDTEDPQKLTESARFHLRNYFLNTKVALTGVNFALADSGAFVVCTNEGNADMGVHLADMHIASMGIEKLIPKTEHLAVFLRLLARSATGQLITAYTSHFRKPEKGKEIHIVLVDNGRSEILGKPDFWPSLKCIRCGACMNTCPIFRKTGGHSYESTIPGPIGAILAPHRNPVKYESLPFASTLCGSCAAVCPVKIDIDKQLYAWRQHLTQEKSSLVLSLMGYAIKSPTLFDVMSRAVSTLQKLMPGLLRQIMKAYTKERELPEVPEQTFKNWYRDNA